MTAEEELGLISLNECSHRTAASVSAVLHTVKRRAIRRAVADQKQRREPGKRIQALGKFRLAVLART